MDIIIKETGKIETLSIIDSKTGVDYIADFIGNTGALTDGQFVLDEDSNAYICDQATFDWWLDVVTNNQAINERINTLSKEHGVEVVLDAVSEAGGVDLENYAGCAEHALDEAFGYGAEVF